jgi:hypothetical protein
MRSYEIRKLMKWWKQEAAECSFQKYFSHVIRSGETINVSNLFSFERVLEKRKKGEKRV